MSLIVITLFSIFFFISKQKRLHIVKKQLTSKYESMHFPSNIPMII